MSTIEEVAQESGVSVTTVSRVINRNGKVSAIIKQKVLAAITKLNYHPNTWGRSLHKGQGRILLILVPNITNPYYPPIVHGIQDVARHNRYQTMLCITDGIQIHTNSYFELLHNGNADGVILMDVKKDDLEVSEPAKGFPVVQCCEYCSDESVGHIPIDNFKTAYDMTHSLCSVGHRKIGLIGATDSFIPTQQRRMGYEKALSKEGITVEQRYITSAAGDYNSSSSVQAACTLFSLPDRPTALFCISDVVALGTFHVAKEMGLRVPEDLSMVGFDDVEYATMFHPMLTTVNQPCYQLGKTSCELLLEQLGRLPPRSAFLEHKTVLRDSSAGLPKNS